MTDRIRTILPAALIGLVVLVGLIWYMAVNPAPAAAPSIPTETAEPVSITEEATYYTVDAQYPSSTPLQGTAGDAANSAAVSLMRAFVEQQIARFVDNGNFANLTHDDIQMLQLDQRKYAIGVEYSIKISPQTVSYIYQIYEDTGGAHPNTYYRTFTFDSSTGAALAMEDLFTAGAPYLDTLSLLSRARLPGMIAERTSSDVASVNIEYIESGTPPEADSFQSFYLEGNTLVLVFPPYQVGPYVLGMIELSLATTEVPGLKSEYVR